MYKIIILLLILGSILAFLFLYQKPQVIIGDDGTYTYPRRGLYALLFSQDGSTLYSPGKDGIAVIDTTTMLVIYELPFNHNLSGIVLSPDEDYLYCTYYGGGDGTGMLSRIRIADGYTEDINLSPINVGNLAIDDTGDYIYVAGGLWPHIGVGVRSDEYNFNLGTGRVIEVSTNSFQITRTADVGVENRGISYQNGKLVVMTSEQTIRPHIPEDYNINAQTAYIIDVSTFQVEHIVKTGIGYHNTSFALPDNNHVMTGWNYLGLDDMGRG